MKVLTLDIWDTVLRRECAPDESKLAAARYLLTYFAEKMNTEEYPDVLAVLRLRGKCEWELAQRSKQAGKDDEYQIRDVIKTLLEAALCEGEETEGLAEELAELELQHEIAITRLDKTILAEIQKRKPDKLYLLSDFYFSGAEMKRILERFQDLLKVDGIFVSCDCGWNKKSGRLFSYAEKELGITPDAHMHLGDSKLADVDIPAGLGITSGHYLPPEEHRQRCEKEHLFEQRKKGDLEGYLKLAENEFPMKGSLPGEKYSLFFFNFVYEILEEAIRRKAEKIYYFTREGEFFKQIHEAIADSGLFPGWVPKAELLEVSRMATFAPSIFRGEKKELMRLWIQYHDQSLRAFFTSLNIEIEPFAACLERYGIDENEVISQIYEDPRVIHMLEDREFKEKLTEKTEKKRELLKAYFTGKGITEGEGCLFIVDIGWRGSIQDNLAVIYPEKRIYGHYLGLFEPFYSPIPNTRKEAFISNHSAEDYLWCLKYVDPVEMLCNSGNGSTTGYLRKPDGVVAVRQTMKEEDSVFYEFTQNFQKEILSCIPAWCSFARRYSIMAGELKPCGLKCLESLITDPDPALADAYFRLGHNENFGKGSVDAKSQRMPYAAVLRAYCSKRGRQAFFRSIEACHWPQGFMKKHRLPWLSEYNRLAKDSFVEYISPFAAAGSRQVDISCYCLEESEVRFYIEDFEQKVDHVELRGWALLPGVDSNRCRILIALTKGQDEFCYETKKMTRKDVTAHFSDGTSYDHSGFTARIGFDGMPPGEYRGEIIVVREEKGMSKVELKQSIRIVEPNMGLEQKRGIEVL